MIEKGKRRKGKQKGGGGGGIPSTGYRYSPKEEEGGIHPILPTGILTSVERIECYVLFSNPLLIPYRYISRLGYT